MIIGPTSRPEFRDFFPILSVNVSLTVDESPGALHVFAALDIIVLIMLLGLVSASLIHRSGVEVELPRSATKFPSDSEALVLTVKGTEEPIFYIGTRIIEEEDLLQSLRLKRDEEGLRMVLLRADARLPATWQRRLSEMILSEDLRCGWLAEPARGIP